MQSVTPNRKIGSIHSSSPIVKQTIEVKHNNRKSKSSLIWGTINAILLAIVFYDVNNKCPFYTSFFHYVEYSLIIIFSLNTIYHFCRFFYNQIRTRPVVITENQKKLLGIKDSDHHFKVSTPKTQSSIIEKGSTPHYSSANNISTLSFRSYSPQSEGNYSMSSPSWVYFRGSPQQSPDMSSVDKSRNLDKSTHLSTIDTSGIEDITDEVSLRSYLHEYDVKEKAAAAVTAGEESPNLLSSFWSHPASRSCNEVSAILKNSTYQLAGQSIAKIMGNAANVSASENRSPTFQRQHIEIWNKLKVDSEKLTQWNANLRMWIYQTVLLRIVSEINSIDNALQRFGFSDVRIGQVGLERLRKTAQTQHAVEHIPTLVSLVSFLEVSSNQEYLVRRVKQLSKGGSISEYRWNGGGDFNGKEWEDHLPTDAAILLHLVTTYLDTQLVPLPHQPEARPFTTRHFLKGTNKLEPNHASVVIHEVTEKPPHYNVIVGGEIQEVGRGPNNLFHVLLLFLYQVNKLEHGMLGRVNLGRSGVNMLWIIDQ